MRILYICSAWPHGPSFGGQLRSLHIGRALRHLGHVSVLTVSSDAEDRTAREETTAEFEVLPPILPHTTADGGVPGKLRRMLDPRCMGVHGLAVSTDDQCRVAAFAAEYDLVWVLNSRTPNILQRWQWPHAHLDIDDVPSTYLRSVAQSDDSPARRWKARIQQRLMHRRERLWAQRFTTLSVCSQPDKDYLGGSENLHIIPNGYQRPATEPLRNLKLEQLRLGFIGLYSYAPNGDGVRWFLKECWPAIRSAVPGIRLRLIGKDTDGPLRPAEPDVDALGWVADSAAEIATWSAMIVPIRFGGGTRIKIAEAFSRKCPAVSTRLGAFGYELTDRKQIRLADDPAGFAQACIDTVHRPEEASTMAERAWTEFLEKWTWEAIAPNVWKAAEDCLRRSKS